MRASTIHFLLILLPCLGACGQDFQLGYPPNPDENDGGSDGGSECAPDAGSGPLPMLTLVGPAIQPQECATPYTDPGATATDACFGDLSSHITRSGTVDTHTPGSYPLTYNVTNPAGRSATPVSRTVNVQDTQPPAVTINGPRSVALECGSPYSDPGATASDTCAGALPAVPTSLPDTRVPGNYSLSYEAVDPSGNSAIAPDARTVTVADTLAPTLTINGPLNPAHECGSTYVDPGAIAGDLCAGDLSSQIVATRTGNPNLPGTMTINYSVTDPAGNTTAAAQPRVVDVTDTTPPMLVLVGPAAQIQECATAYIDLGAVAIDACFGDVSSRITRSGTVDSRILGSYLLNYNVSDPEGQSATPVTRTVLVEDHLPPAVSISGPRNITLECGGPYNEPGATASDACAGALPAGPTSLPDTRVPGSYSLGYQATDPSGNTGIAPNARTVTVADTLAPTLTVNGPLNELHECGPGYVDPGATAGDVCAGDLSSRVVATRTGSPNAEGTMTITYSVADPSGNTTTAPEQRLVDVIDTRPPALTLHGPNPRRLECATPYTDPGASASDACYGDLSSRITRTGTVDPNTVGSYPLTYSVSDPGGRNTTVSLTVDVSDTMPPFNFIIWGHSTMFVECRSPYNEAGATAIDACAGNIPAMPIGTPDTSIPGTYSVGYRATDPSGNTAFSPEVRVVNVRDTERPTLTVLGPLSMVHECGPGYVDPGATADDVCAGDLPVVATRTGSPTVEGTMTINYSATDPSGNTTTAPQQRMVNVTDTLPPTLVLHGPNPQVHECATPYADPGATATDACYGDVSNRLIRSGTVNAGTVGSYALAYSVSDPGGRSTTASRTVNVSDTRPPDSFTLNGPSSLIVECGSPYSDPGASAFDACAGGIPAMPVGSPDTSIPGTYGYGYRATDPSGNTAFSPMLRTVGVTDSLRPELQVLPGPSVIECNGPPYVDPGATASDQCAGGLTHAINVTSDLDQSREGQYTITYDVTDPYGHTSVATRPITVVGPCALCFSLGLSGYNLLLLEDSDEVHSVQGRVEAGGERAAARFAELRGLSSRLAGLSASGAATRESRDVLRLKGTDPALNVFKVEASELTRDTRLSIDAPAGSLVVVNVHGETVALEGLGQAFSGGIGSQDVLYNFVNATRIRAEGTVLEGTVLAPYAHIGFTDGSWKGGLYAVSLTGDAQGYLSPLNGRELCP